MSPFFIRKPIRGLKIRREARLGRCGVLFLVACGVLKRLALEEVGSECRLATYLFKRGSTNLYLSDRLVFIPFIGVEQFVSRLVIDIRVAARSRTSRIS